MPLLRSSFYLLNYLSKYFSPPELRMKSWAKALGEKSVPPALAGGNSCLENLNGH